VRGIEDWKIKISVLWLFTIVVGLASGILGLLEPGAIEQIMTGEVEGMIISPEFLFLFAIIFLIPPIMAFLSLTLKDSVNRWSNIIVSIVWIVLSLIDIPMYVANPSAYAILMWLAGVVAPALIIWYAWKSK